MTFFHDSIIPYIGTDTFKLGETLDKVRAYLKDNKIKFNQGVEPNKGCEPEIPWTIIKISDSITLCFVFDILFEIALEGDYSGKLSNGGFVGMKITELKQIDPSLEYNDDDEDFISKDGYWVTYDSETGDVCMITIFLPEVEKDDFFKYKWVNNYTTSSPAR